MLRWSNLVLVLFGERVEQEWVLIGKPLIPATDHERAFKQGITKRRESAVWSWLGKLQILLRTAEPGIGQAEGYVQT